MYECKSAICSIQCKLYLAFQPPADVVNRFASSSSA